MNVLMSAIVGVVSLVGGYFAFRLTGSWFAIPIAIALIVFTGWKLLAGEFVIALIVFCAGLLGIFNFMVGGKPETAKIVWPEMGVMQSAREMVADLKGSVAAGARTVPKNGAADKGAPPASDAVASSGQAGTKAAKGFRDCTDCPELVVLPAGKFEMGSAAAAPAGQGDAAETPQHSVTVRSFAMGQDAVTKGQFSAFVKAAGYQTDAERLGGCFSLEGDSWQFKPQLNWKKTSFVQTNDHPAICITWNDATAYAQWLATLTQKKYRLPTEAEREYATRAGTVSSYWWGEGVTPAQANFHADPSATVAADKPAWRKATMPVKQFAANPFGLYNLSGNVSEWVQDCQHDNYKGAPADATAWAATCVGTRRGVRGGGWASPAAGLRSAQRGWFEPDLPSHAAGFRIVRDLP